MDESRKERKEMVMMTLEFESETKGSMERNRGLRGRAVV